MPNQVIFMDNKDIVCYNNSMGKVISIGKQKKITSVAKHAHDYWEVIYCSYGGGRIISGDACLDYKKSDVVIIPPKTHHSNISDSVFSNIHLELDASGLPFLHIQKFSDNAAKHIYLCLTQLYYYFNSDESNKIAILKSLSELLANYLISFCETERYSDLIELIRNDILKNFSDRDYCIEKALSEMPYNREYLCKLFKKETGITPLQYLTQVRINSAKNLLINKNVHRMSIIEISDLCGFTDSLYFSRVFKKYNGCSPNKYTIG